MAVFAWILPAAWGLAQALTLRHAPQGVQARVVVGGLLALVWIGLFVCASWRRTWIEVAQLLHERLGFAGWLVLACCALLFGSGSAAWWFLALGASASLMAVSAWWSQFGADRTRALQGFALLAVWALALAGLDVFVAHYVLPNRSHDKIFMEHDPVLGWRLRKNFALERREPQYTSVETTHSLGFRTPDRELVAPKGVLRVVMLGDSHTEGYTVDDDKTLAQRLDAALGDRVEVISLGVGGYSTDQEYLSYLEVGRAFHPDLVVLQFCSNDLPFNVSDRYWRGSKPYFVRYGDQLSLRGVPVPNTKTSGLLPAFVVEHSALFTFLEGQLRQLGVRRHVEQEVDMEEAWKVTECLLRDLRDAVHADGAELVCYHVNTEETDVDTRLQAVLQRTRVPYWDISPAYKVDANNLWVSEHWNELGQARVADALLPELRAALAPQLTQDAR
ncbi:MAG TPA: SGNH/GDSL hydrolase family protein [Planctomycetota bacterium]|nr:SGNH/GDSL hydrolase family protein [Planctomycetota bacterium]